MMTIHVELFGIPRQRAGIARCDLTFPHGETTLGEVLRELGRQFPAFASDCLCDDRLAATYAANVNGQRFVNDPATKLFEGDELLILSADAGG